MSSRLDCITDWDGMAVSANYRVAELAKTCRVDERQLRRYFIKKFGCSPHFWMSETRLKKLYRQLQKGNLIKEVAASGGFSQPSNFTRKFKEYYGKNPSAVRGLGP
jgi:AraC family chitin signaling transcriptional activator